ncbi:class A beta-lactamase-related serine hydrolase [Gammaproteobacteria bacterium LSUCC0112]|nr:class A beta-lactamase-related serine hydrolase [Gammaproteobacteria bacterium LSUCC0112]
MAEPESVGMSSERLQRIDAFTQRYIDDEMVAGTVTLVARRGKVVHFSAQGMKDVERNQPMTKDTIFRMASMTKPIASVALMMLYEEGYFQLDDPISDWLPEFKNMMVEVEQADGTTRLEPAKTPISFTHILTHTAGLMNSYRGDIARYSEVSRVQGDENLASWTERLATLPLRYEPGTRWEYSAATSVVGRLVEVISGDDLDTFLRERIFSPLQMNDTHFYLPPDKVNRFATLYGPDADNGNRMTLTEVGDERSNYVSGPRAFFSGAGGLVSTAHDYIRFQQMMLNGGELDGVRLLGSKTVELIFANHTGDLPLWLSGPGMGFGLGYSVVLDRAVAHTSDTEGAVSWGGAFGTLFWIDPEEELVAIILTQIRPYSHIRLREGFHNVVNQAIVD